MRAGLQETFAPVWQAILKKDFNSYSPDQALALKNAPNIITFDERFRSARDAIIAAVKEGALKPKEGRRLASSLKTQFLPVRDVLVEAAITKRYAKEVSALTGSTDTETFDSHWKHLETTIGLDFFRRNISDAHHLKLVLLIDRLKARYQPIRDILAGQEAPTDAVEPADSRMPLAIKEALQEIHTDPPAGETEYPDQAFEETRNLLQTTLVHIQRMPEANASPDEKMGLLQLASDIIEDMHRRNGTNLPPDLVALHDQLAAALRSQKPPLPPDDEKNPEAVTPLGGIFLDRAMLDLQIRRDRAGVALPIEKQPIESMTIQGFLPVIMDIKTIENLSL